MKYRDDNKHDHYPLKLYTDGGVISKNPSPYGGTWAWILVRDEQIVDQGSGILRPEMIDLFNTVTNNQSELFALIRGLSCLEAHVTLEICSDSNVSLGRVFRGSSFHNIPSWMVGELNGQRRRFLNWSKFSYTLMDGHPTKEHLALGIGKRGHPVSIFNKMCDDLCREQSDLYWKNQ